MKSDSINNTSFQAKLDIRRVKTNKARWENIAKTFNKETKDIQGRIKISEFKQDTIISASRHNNPNACDDITIAAFNTTLEKLLAKYSDNTIAKKLTNLLNIGSIAGSRKEKALDKFYRKACCESKFQEKTLKFQYDSINNVARNKADRDAFLRNFEIILD